MLARDRYPHSLLTKQLVLFISNALMEDTLNSKKSKGLKGNPSVGRIKSKKKSRIERKPLFGRINLVSSKLVRAFEKAVLEI